MQKTFWPQAKLSASPSAWKVGNWILFFSLVGSNGIPIPTPNWLMPQLIKLVLTLTRQNYLRSNKDIWKLALFFPPLSKIVCTLGCFCFQQCGIDCMCLQKAWAFPTFPLYPIWIWKKKEESKQEFFSSIFLNPISNFTDEIAKGQVSQQVLANLVFFVKKGLLSSFLFSIFFLQYFTYHYKSHLHLPPIHTGVPGCQCSNPVGDHRHLHSASI